ncbi:MAG TPA: histone deacetylase [Gemmatimonadota bacterium]|jgi:acetoin utilization deacetylase AcuC-like enzyme|nr:histone deacetylase [Gemmatimonadota bacterium]
MVPGSQLDGRIVTSPAYETDIGPHVFPTEKYRGVRERLQEEGLTKVVEPEPPDREELLQVHTAAYLDDLAALRWTPRTWRSELPISEPIVRWFELSCGGTVAAARLALASGWAAHLGGGFHHAFADHAEGFCYLNDLAVAARVLQTAGEVERVAVIDVDVHQGNGTAAIFADDPSVFTFSIHQEDNYPLKERSDLDVGLLSYDRSRPGSPYVTDDLYLDLVESALPRILDRFRPDLVLYQAGADPYEKDRLGGFRLTLEGLARRDATVIGACGERGIPVAITLGGGYAEELADTVAIHTGTVLAAARLGDVAGRALDGKLGTADGR